MSFISAFIYLCAAVIAVPIVKRLGFGSVLGYLVAGMIIGPSCLGFVGTDGQDVMHTAEFGVVMMLFLIGLELRPSMLWKMRGSILGMGGLQVAGTTGAGLLIGLLVGMPWQIALAAGLIFAMSSTAIALQSLNEKGLIKTPGGQASFSVLLFQDIAVIPMLALLPLLATLPEQAGSGASGHAQGMGSLPGWQQGGLIIGAVLIVIICGRYLLRPIFRYIAATRLREMFTATALLLVMSISLLMQQVGLSPALGAFLGGVVLADSEYRHQLEADVEPFKGLLLGLFFISVGVTIDFALMSQKAGLIALLLVALVVVKFAVLFVVGRFFKLKACNALLFAFALAQGGEFAFVLISFAQQHSVFTSETSKLMMATVAASMALAPLLLMLNEKLVQPCFSGGLVEREPDEIDVHDNPVILAGFGRFGHIVGRLLSVNGFTCTVLDHDPEQVEMLRRFGLKCFYGDATRIDLLHSAGAAQAKLFILALREEEKSLHIVKTVQEHFPNLRILARANGRQHAYDLLRAGVNDVYRETLGSALDMGEEALRALGLHAKRAHRAAQIFKKHDEESVREFARFSGSDEEYASLARLHIRNLEQVFQSDSEYARDEVEDAWEAADEPEGKEEGKEEGKRKKDQED